MSHNMIDQMVPVHCTNNDKETNGYIINVRLEKFIDVSMNTVKVHFDYVAKHKHYVGRMAGLEFTVKASDLPDDPNIKTFRRTR